MAASAVNVTASGTRESDAVVAPSSADPAEPSEGSRRRERKVVTVLFCDLVEFTAASDSSDPEDVDAARPLLHGGAWEIRALRRDGREVHRRRGDGGVRGAGGTRGRPRTRGSGRACSRGACGPASAMTRCGAAWVRIGITTGEVLARLDPAAARGEAMVSGDVVNTASRLQAAAPAGRVLWTPRRTRLPRRRFDTSSPSPSWRRASRTRSRMAGGQARRSGDTAMRSVPLVGRVYESGTLVNTTAARCEESAQLVSLVGVPGIGKTRLVAELRQYVDADPRETTWRQGRSLAYGEGVAFWALGEIVKSPTRTSARPTRAARPTRSCAPA